MFKGWKCPSCNWNTYHPLKYCPQCGDGLVEFDYGTRANFDACGHEAYEKGFQWGLHYFDPDTGKQYTDDIIARIEEQRRKHKWFHPGEKVCHQGQIYVVDKYHYTEDHDMRIFLLGLEDSVAKDDLEWVDLV